jgi:hypothetical protein
LHVSSRQTLPDSLPSLHSRAHQAAHATGRQDGAIQPGCHAGPVRAAQSPSGRTNEADRPVALPRSRTPVRVRPPSGADRFQKGNPQMSTTAGVPARQIESSQAMPRNRTENQVVRRIKFSEAHPEVNFVLRRETGKWEATYPTGGNGARTVYDSDLGDLLDKLEERFG